jgi:hypothetical protein
MKQSVRIVHSISAVVLLLSILGPVGCAKGDAGSAPSPTAANAPTSNDVLASALGRARAPRRIIRDAKLTVEVNAVAGARASISKIVEQAGGYVASAQASETGEGLAGDVELGLRVPSDRFTEVLGRIKGLGHAKSEEVSSHDVTEEFVDLDARIAAGQRVEAQYLAMLERAATVNDLLAVQRELGSVRTDIERLEGRRRLLGEQAALSAISLRLTVPAPLVTATWRAVRTDAVQAAASVVDVSATLISVLLKLLAVLLPTGVLIGAPSFFVLRALVRRSRGRAPYAGSGMAPPA